MLLPASLVDNTPKLSQQDSLGRYGYRRFVCSYILPTSSSLERWRGWESPSGCLANSAAIVTFLLEGCLLTLPLQPWRLLAVVAAVLCLALFRQPAVGILLALMLAAWGAAGCLHVRRDLLCTQLCCTCSNIPHQTLLLFLRDCKCCG